MGKENVKPGTIDEYIALFPQDVQARLQALRTAIREAAPEAVEKISYGMPTFFLSGNLIHFAAFTRHIGIYPLPSGIEEFKKELASFASAKGSVRFPLDGDIPLDLIKRIVKFRITENKKKEETKKTKKKG